MSAFHQSRSFAASMLTKLTRIIITMILGSLRKLVAMLCIIPSLMRLLWLGGALGRSESVLDPAAWSHGSGSQAAV